VVVKKKGKAGGVKAEPLLVRATNLLRQKLSFQRNWRGWRLMHTAGPKAMGFLRKRMWREGLHVWLRYHRHDLTTPIGQAHKWHLYKFRQTRCAVLISAAMSTILKNREIEEEAEREKRKASARAWARTDESYTSLLARQAAGEAEWGAKIQSSADMRRRVHRRSLTYAYMKWLTAVAECLSERSSREKERADKRIKRDWELDWRKRFTGQVAASHEAWALATVGAPAVIAHHLGRTRARTVAGSRQPTPQLPPCGGLNGTRAGIVTRGSVRKKRAAPGQPRRPSTVATGQPVALPAGWGGTLHALQRGYQQQPSTTTTIALTSESRALTSESRALTRESRAGSSTMSTERATRGEASPLPSHGNSGEKPLKLPGFGKNLFRGRPEKGDRVTIISDKYSGKSEEELEAMLAALRESERIRQAQLAEHRGLESILASDINSLRRSQGSRKSHRLLHPPTPSEEEVARKPRHRPILDRAVGRPRMLAKLAMISTIKEFDWSQPQPGTG